MSAKFSAPSSWALAACSALAGLAITTVSHAQQPAPAAEPPPSQPAPSPPAPTAAPTPAPSDDSQLDLGVSAPKDWAEDTDMVLPLQQAFRETTPLDDFGETGGAAAYVLGGTGALYVAWIKTTVPTDKPAPALRKALDALRAEPQGAALEAGVVEELEYNEQVFKKAIEARLAWRHKDNETLTISRALAWHNSDKLMRVVRAECVFPESEKKTVTQMCQRALLSLSSTELDAGKALALEGFTKPAGAAEPTKEPTEENAGPSLQPTSKTTPMVVTNDQKKPRDRKNLWIFIIGAALIAFAFYSVLQSKREADEGAKEADADKGEEEE